jgi:hypothetical protein
VDSQSGQIRQEQEAPQTGEPGKFFYVRLTAGFSLPGKNTIDLPSFLRQDIRN